MCFKNRLSLIKLAVNKIIFKHFCEVKKISHRPSINNNFDKLGYVGVVDIIKLYAQIDYEGKFMKT